ncbi:nucleoside monophosphate kinase [Catenulispora yoronensis]
MTDEIPERPLPATKRPAAIAVFGPPAAGKSTLCRALLDPARVFRLREHVSGQTLRATQTTATSLGWIEPDEVARVLHEYFTSDATAPDSGDVLLDNFPGTGDQVHQWLSIMAEAAPGYRVVPVELDAEDSVLLSRAACRRVCADCEPDAAGEPRLPAAIAKANPSRCGDCGSILARRPTDEPRTLAHRILRYRRASAAIRIAFADHGLPVWTLDGSLDQQRHRALLTRLLTNEQGVDQ